MEKGEPMHSNRRNTTTRLPTDPDRSTSPLRALILTLGVVLAFGLVACDPVEPTEGDAGAATTTPVESEAPTIDEAADEAGDTLNEAADAAGDTIEDAATDLENNVELAAAKAEARTTLLAEQTRIEAAEELDQVGDVIANARENLAEAYQAAGAEATEEWNQLSAEFDALEQQLEAGEAEATETFQDLLNRLGEGG